MSCYSRVSLSDTKKMPLAVLRALQFFKKNPSRRSYDEGYGLHQSTSDYSEVDNSTLTEILENLGSLSLEPDFYELCVSFVNKFLEVGEIELVKQSLCLDEEEIKNILDTLRAAAIPF